MVSKVTERSGGHRVVHEVTERSPRGLTGHKLVQEVTLQSDRSQCGHREVKGHSIVSEVK